MKRHSTRRHSATIVALVGVVMVSVQAPAAWGFDIPEAKTEAEIVDPSSDTPSILMELQAALDAIPPDPVREDVVISWKDAGGVEPEPFRVLIPAGCFGANETGFHVEDFRACGVTLSFDGQLLRPTDFEARLLLRDDGTARLDLGVFYLPPDDSAPARGLSQVGGAQVEITIGRVGSVAPLLEVDTLSGVEPQPF